EGLLDRDVDRGRVVHDDIPHGRHEQRERHRDAQQEQQQERDDHQQESQNALPFSIPSIGLGTASRWRISATMSIRLWIVISPKPMTAEAYTSHIGVSVAGEVTFTTAFAARVAATVSSPAVSTTTAPANTSTTSAPRSPSLETSRSTEMCSRRADTYAAATNVVQINR